MWMEDTWSITAAAVSGAARVGEGGSFPPWVDVQKLCNMRVMNVRKDRQAANLLKSYRTKPYKFPMHWSKCVSFWGTSYSRPPIDPYLLVGGVA